MVPLSVLDLSPIVEGGDAAGALNNSLDLARHAERLGYLRFWLAEHHNLPGVASAATSIAIAHVAQGTKTIRVGAGGIMLPNHAPLMVAEQFGTLESLFPGRIDLGLGRAPGTDQLTAHALRRTMHADPETFPRDVVELMAYFEPPQPGQRIIAVPGAGLNVPVWILGSSHFGASVAAALGLPFAFASHFAPAMMEDALKLYRANFRPSAHLAAPYVMMGFNVFAAETDEEARFLSTSVQQAFVNLARGRPSPLPAPIEGFETQLTPPERARLDAVLSCSAVGAPGAVKQAMRAFIARTGADELMATCQMYDHAKRVRSLEIAAAMRDEIIAEERAKARA